MSEPCDDHRCVACGQEPRAAAPPGELSAEQLAHKIEGTYAEWILGDSGRLNDEAERVMWLKSELIAYAHAVRQQAERDIETLKRVLNDARKSFGRNGTIEFDHLESQIAKLTAERERLNEQVVQLCGDVKAIAGDYTDAVTAKRRAESALGEARGLILDEARARVLLTVRDWPGVGTSKLNELDDAILALKAEDK